MTAIRAVRVDALRDLLAHLDDGWYVVATPGGNLTITTARRLRPGDTVGHVDMGTGRLVLYAREETERS